MSQSPIALLFNGNRRLRILFTGPLAAGAFTSTSLYAVATPLIAPISVLAVFAIAGNANAVELAIDSDASDDATYTVTCTAVPFADTSTFTGSIAAQSGGAVNTPGSNTEPETSDADAQTYGVDLLHDGNDFVESADGDLATITGRSNWQGAIQRRIGSNGLLWDGNYGGKPQQYVDGPQPLALTLAGSLISQAKQDDRTANAKCDVSTGGTDQNSATLNLTIFGKDGKDPLTVPAPLPTST